MQKSETISLDDSVLVERCKRGDSDAMHTLIVKYQDRIYNVILKICSNPEDAAELTQETFVKFIEKLNTFKSLSSFYTWLFRIAVNLTLNFCRKRFKVSMQSLDAAMGSDFEESRNQLKQYFQDTRELDPSVVAYNREVAEIITRCLGQVSDEHRVVLVLRDIEGMSYQDIAELLNIELGTVKSRLSRARISLKEILETVLQ